MKKRGAIVAGAIAAAMGLGLSGNAAFAVDSFTFDADGTGGAGPISNVATFDYAPGNALAVGGATAIGNFLTGVGSTEFDTYIQSKLVGLLNNSNNNVTPIGMTNGTFEITAVGGFRESVSFANLAAGVATFSVTGDTGAGVPNFFEIYYDDTPDANDLAGTGFNDGKLILSATILGGNSSFVVTGGGAGTPLDGFGTDNYPAIDSVNGVGSTQLTARVDFVDTAFFLNDLVSFDLSILNSAQNLNFSQVDPSARFVFGSGGAAPVLAGAGTGSLSAVNGLGGGPDVQFQIDAAQSFETSVIPEPATAGLGLMGLGALALGLRRRRLA